MNEYETERIAKAINVLRPDWPVNSLITLMAKEQLKHRPRRDVLVALCWVASESNSHTPARVLEAGPWWKATQADGDTGGGHKYPMRAGDPDECRTHRGQHRDHCSGCAADRLVHESTPARVPPAGDRDELITNIREQIKAAKAALQPPVTKAGRQEEA